MSATEVDGEDPELSGLERRLLELAAEDREIERQEEEQAAALAEQDRIYSAIRPMPYVKI